MFKMWIFMFNFIGVFASPNVTQNDDYFENCLQDIISVEFSNDVILFYGANRFTYKNLSAKNSVIIRNKSDLNRTNEIHRMSHNEKISTIFFVHRIDDVDTLKRLLRTTSFYKRKFLVLCKNEEVNVTDVLRVARNYGVFHVAFGFIAGQDVEFRSWFPFDAINKCGVNFNVEKVEVCSEKYVGATLYRDKLYNLQDCSLKTAYVKAEPFVVDANLSDNPGLLISLFNAVSNATGARIEYEREESFESEFLNEGTMNGLFDRLISGESDVILGRLFMNTTSAYTEPGRQIYTEDIVWVAPKPKYSTVYRNVLKVFTRTTWVLYTTSFVFTTAILMLILRQYPDLNVSKCRVVMDMFRLSISGPAHIAPRKAPLRLILIFYTLYCMNMDAIYLGKLSSIFTTPRSTTKISNVEIFYISGLFVNLTCHMEKITRLCDSLTNDHVANSTNILNETDYDLFRKVAERQENGTITFKSIVETYTSEAATVDMFVTKPHTLFLCYYVRKANILNDPIAYWTLEVLEKGIMAKWWDDLILERRNYTLWRMGQKEDDEAIVLGLIHYEEAFIILIGGVSLSTAIFALEFVFKGLENKVGAMKKYSTF